MNPARFIRCLQLVFFRITIQIKIRRIDRPGGGLIRTGFPVDSLLWPFYIALPTMISILIIFYRTVIVSFWNSSRNFFSKPSLKVFLKNYDSFFDALIWNFSEILTIAYIIDFWRPIRKKIFCLRIFNN